MLDPVLLELLGRTSVFATNCILLPSSGEEIHRKFGGQSINIKEINTVAFSSLRLNFHKNGAGQNVHFM